LYLVTGVQTCALPIYTSKEFFGSCASRRSSSRVCVTSLMTDELLIR
jgi:hypothetical protein